jgi:hypothetical protein
MFGFIIACCLRNDKHYQSFINCIGSIQLFHSEKIVVIVDFTSNTDYVNRAINKYPSVIFEINTPEVPADMLCLEYFKNNKYFETAIIIQDSMYLIDKIDPSHVADISYIWHFTNHRIHWSFINEPDTQFNKKNNIKTHDDLVIYCLNNFTTNNSFKTYALDLYYNKYNWVGCFGLCCIITHDFVNKLHEDTGIFDITVNMTDNRLRRAIESVFSLACVYSTGRNITSSFDGLYYDGYYHNNFKGKYIEKQSFNRE